MSKAVMIRHTYVAVGILVAVSYGSGAYAAQSQAVPTITDEVIARLKTPNATGEISTLIKALGILGPSAIPSLVRIAESSTHEYITFDALTEIASLEPPGLVFGQLFSPWTYWKGDPREADVRRELVPLLPRVRELMERTRLEQKYWYPHRVAAYLMARWGEGDMRARGIEVLEELAQSKDPFYTNLEAVRFLHALDAPSTTPLIWHVATKVYDLGNQRNQYMLQLATALHQRGRRDYEPLLSVALRDPAPYVRMEAARLISVSGEISNATLVLPLLDDFVAWNGRSVALAALQSLERLTLEQLGADPASWRTWLEANRDTTRGAQVARRVKALLAVAPDTPSRDVSRWLDQFDGADGAAVLPLVDHYLGRKEIIPLGLGAGIGGGSSGGGRRTHYPGISGTRGPRVVTLLLEMSMQGVPGALQRLTACLDAADPQVRLYGAFALAHFDRPKAIAHIQKETNEPLLARKAAEFLEVLAPTAQPLTR